MDIEILIGGSLAMSIVAFGFAMTLIHSMQVIDVMWAVQVEDYQLGAVALGVLSFILILFVGKS